ncbi:hypothetical protein [Pseudonocardia sp.]|uniref:hypothetical protein n=1 Tax=Pseudonocardia sp. TaxID=60912 RepID=UPI003D11ECCF
MTKKKVFSQLRDTLDVIDGSSDHIERLGAAHLLRQLAEQLERDVVDEARASGARWADIGEVYGTSKQSVQQRFANRQSRTS